MTPTHVRGEYFGRTEDGQITMMVEEVLIDGEWHEVEPHLHVIDPADLATEEEARALLDD